MAELEREKLITHVLGEFCGVDCPINYGQTIDGTVVETDGWLVPTSEIKRIHDARDAILESPDFYSLDAEDALQPLSEADLRFVSCSIVANVNLMLLPVHGLRISMVY
jgi:midasin